MKAVLQLILQDSIDGNLSSKEIAKKCNITSDYVYNAKSKLRQMGFNISDGRTKFSGKGPKPKGFGQKISKAMKGTIVAWGWKISKTRKEKGIKPWNTGRKIKHSQNCNCPFCVGTSGEANPSKRPEVRAKISNEIRQQFASGLRTMALDKNPAWRGGLSFEPYSPEFNDNLKKLILERDSYTCSQCRMSENESITAFGQGLIVHHKDFNKKNNNQSNLITLCRKCHGIINAEVFKERRWQV